MRKMKPRFTERPSSRAAPRRRPSVKGGEGVKVEKAVSINRPADELYRFWREFDNLPRFMQHVESVECADNGISHWVIRSSKGLKLQWDAKIIEDKPGEIISWQSLEGAEVDNAGSVWFKPAGGNRGTVVKVSMKYSPLGGKAGAAVAKLLGDSAEKQIAEDLFRFKSLMETGEMPTTKGQPIGRNK